MGNGYQFKHSYIYCVRLGTVATTGGKPKHMGVSKQAALPFRLPDALILCLIFRSRFYPLRRLFSIVAFIVTASFGVFAGALIVNRMCFVWSSRKVFHIPAWTVFKTTSCSLQITFGKVLSEPHM